MIARRLSSDLNPSDVLQGHNGEVQRFTMEKQQLVRDHRRGIQLDEWLIRDQWFNFYLVHGAMLPDGEDWNIRQWVEPAEVARLFGPSCPLCSDPALNYYRERAFAEIERVAEEIKRRQG